MCLCIKNLKEVLKSLNGYGVRLLEKDKKNLVVTDLFLTDSEALTIEQYSIPLNEFKDITEEDVIELFNTVNMFTFKESENLGKIQTIAVSIVNEFEIKKLVKMPMYQTEIDFINSDCMIVGYLAQLN